MVVRTSLDIIRKLFVCHDENNSFILIIKIEYRVEWSVVPPKQSGLGLGAGVMIGVRLRVRVAASTR